MRRGYGPRILARALRAWLACTMLALTCAGPALESARAQVVVVAEPVAERAELPAEQCQAERSLPPTPGLAHAARVVRQRGVRPRVQVLLHAPPLYLEHCALLL